MTPIPALTLHQPWASLVMAGVKRVENRSWAPVQLRGPDPRPMWVIIHAGLRLDKDRVMELGLAHPRLQPLLAGQFLDRGQVLGVACISRAVPVDQVIDLFATGPWCWMLDRVLQLPEPIPARGRQGLWRPDPEVGEAIAELLRASGEIADVEGA